MLRASAAVAARLSAAVHPRPPIIVALWIDLTMPDDLAACSRLPQRARRGPTNPGPLSVDRGQGTAVHLPLLWEDQRAALA